MDEIKPLPEPGAQNCWWDEMPDNVRNEVEEAMAEAERGEGIPHEEVKKKYSKWFVR